MIAVVPFAARRRCALVLAIALGLGGCETMSTRNCPAFEGHPDLASWMPYAVGDSLTYASEQGETETYTLRLVERSEAYADTDFGDSEDIRCRATAEHLFESSGGDHFLSEEFDVIDVEGVPAAERPLFVVIAALGTPDATAPSTASFRQLLSDPRDPAGNNSTERFEVTFSATREVGQATYRDVLESSVREPFIDRNLPPETTLTRVVFARDAGLVEFERSDGRIFTLLPP